MTRPFNPSAGATTVLGHIKRNHQESSTRDEKNTVSIFFNFCENDYNLAENNEFLARSIFSSAANFCPLMKHDGVLESQHQGDLVFGHLAVFRKIAKLTI